MNDHTFQYYSACFLLFFFATAAQAQEITRIKLADVHHTIIGNDSLEQAFSAIPLDNQSFLVAGLSYEKEIQGDLVLTKVRNDLSVVWEKKIGLPQLDYVFSGINVSDGNILWSGFRRHAGNLDAWLLKVKPNGDTLWSKTVGGPGDDRAIRAIETRDKNYVVAGQTASWGAGTIDGLLLKVDPQGTLLWKKTFGTESLERTYALIELDNGDLIVSGINNANYPENSDILLLRITKDGELIWKKTIGSDKGDIAHGMLVKDESSFLTVGYTAEYSYPLCDPLVVHFDHNGKVLGKYTIRTGSEIKLVDGYMLSSETLVSAGFVRDSANDKWDPIVAELDFRTSRFKLTRILAGDEDDEIFHLIPMDNKTSLLVGYSFSSSNRKGDMLLVKFPH
jgi:hypothetical protein